MSSEHTNKDWLYQKYITEELNCVQIGQLVDLSPAAFTFTPNDMLSATVMIEGGAGGTTKVFGQGVNDLAENLAKIGPVAEQAAIERGE